MDDKQILEAEIHEFWPELRRKIVKTRKDHDCSYCGKVIPTGTKCRLDVGTVPYDGFISLYTCFECVDEIANLPLF